MNKQEFKDRLTEKYGDKFEIIRTPLRIMPGSEIVLRCTVHGDFRTTTESILHHNATTGCPKCRKSNAMRNYRHKKSVKNAELERQVVLYTHEK